MNIAHLAHDAVGVGDDEAGEATVVLFEPVGALCVWLARHFRMEVSKLLAELFDLALCLQVLEGAADGRIGEADGDGVQGPSVEFGMSLHDIEGALRGKRVVVSMDMIDDLAFFCLGVGGDGEAWAYRSAGRLGGQCTWERDGRWVDVGFSLGVGEVGRSGGRFHECDGGGTELCLGRDDFDAIAEDGGAGFDGGRHGMMVWKCW